MKHPVLNRFRLKRLQEQIGSSIMSVIPSLEGLAVNEKLSAFDQKAMNKFLQEAQTIAENESGSRTKVDELVKIF